MYLIETKNPFGGKDLRTKCKSRSDAHMTAQHASTITRASVSVKHVQSGVTIALYSRGVLYYSVSVSGEVN